MLALIEICPVTYTATMARSDRTTQTKQLADAANMLYALQLLSHVPSTHIMGEVKPSYVPPFNSIRLKYNDETYQFDLDIPDDMDGNIAMDWLLEEIKDLVKTLGPKIL